MKFTKLFLFLLFAFILTACSPQPKTDLPVLQDSNGNSIKLAGHHNQWIVINYWADWCGPCHREIPQLNAFYQKYKNKNVVLLGVNYDQVSTDQLKDIVKKMQIQFPVLTTDPSKQLGLPDISAVPTTIFIAPNGTKKQLIGEQTEKTLEAVLN